MKHEQIAAIMNYGVRFHNVMSITRRKTTIKGTVAECAFVTKFLNFETELLNKL